MTVTISSKGTSGIWEVYLKILKGWFEISQEEATPEEIEWE